MTEKNSATNKLLSVCKEHKGEWVCSFCNSGSGQPAAVTRTLRSKGYEFEEPSPGRWAKQMYCPICGKIRSHVKLLSLEPVIDDEKKRFTISKEDRERVISILGTRDAYTGASIVSSVPEIDHKVPFSRLNEDIKIKSLSNEEIPKHFQILTRHNNLLKEKACKECKLTGIRPKHMEVEYWYVGDENYVDEACGGCGCKGCGWYDGVAWREALNKFIKKYNDTDLEQKLISAIKKIEEKL